MLRRLKDLEPYTVTATDGDIGKVVDFLVDDQRWAVRYLIVQTDGLLAPHRHHRVLISPIFFRQVDWSAQRFHLALTIDKVKSSPDVDVDKPVSRQHERDYYGHYDYPVYWGYEELWGKGAYPGLLQPGGRDQTLAEKAAPTGDAHLHSVNEVRGYHIQGSDDTIGHVDDFIVDDETWAVRYLVIDTSNWWVGKKVLIAPHWASHISWEERKVHVDLSRQTIKGSPEWSPTVFIDREFESRLHAYYERPAYWSGERPHKGRHAG